MQEYKAKNKEKCLLSHEDASLDDINDLQSLPRVRTREQLHAKFSLGELPQEFLNEVVEK
ncbi:hypothetical protein Ahy_B05g075650 isoform B [Arachis hypogaea]|uniref:Uncharacterized protein n=1 Tax=Arachis hypogaea TaxID=3818 RepID=A0A444Z1Q1_ARAHY|nr:hypothetical protein Ahy_B05g075650 isoform B [Arachis hypogaea]